MKKRAPTPLEVDGPMVPEDLTAHEVVVAGKRVVALGFRIAKESAVERSRLTTAEREVVTLVLAGRTNAEIGRRRKTSPRTVANQLASIYRKLGVSSRRSLCVMFLSRPKSDH